MLYPVFPRVVVYLATLFQYRYRTRLVPKYYSDVTQSRLDVIQEGQDEYPQLNEVVGQFKWFISSEMNRGVLFYIFDPFILSWDPPNMILKPCESFYDENVHLPPPAQHSSLGQTLAKMRARVRPGGCRLNLQGSQDVGGNDRRRRAISCRLDIGHWFPVGTGN